MAKPAPAPAPALAGWTPRRWLSSIGQLQELLVRVESGVHVAGEAQDDEGRRVVIFQMRSGQYLLLCATQRARTHLEILGPCPIDQLGQARMQIASHGGLDWPDAYKGSVGAMGEAIKQATTWHERRQWEQVRRLPVGEYEKQNPPTPAPQL